MNINTRTDRFRSWLGWKLFGFKSPTLSVEGRAPSLRWIWTGRGEHAPKVSKSLGEIMDDGFRRGLSEKDPT